MKGATVFSGIGAPEVAMPWVEWLNGRATVDISTGCWNWRGATNGMGYGKASYKGRNSYAHRVVYEIVFGPIATGMLVCHKCDNPGCVNPGHMFLGTVSDNARDAVAKGRHSSIAHRESRPRGRSHYLHKERCLIVCACGCGRELITPDKKGRDRKYVLGHSGRWIA